jgi:hypothetical protein
MKIKTNSSKLKRLKIVNEDEQGICSVFPRQSLPSLTHSSSNKQESVNKKATDIWKA